MQKNIFSEKKDLVNYAVSKAVQAGAEYAEATLEHTRGEGYVMKEGKLDAPVSTDDIGLRIRFVKKGYIYSIYTNQPKKELIENLLESNMLLRGEGPTGMEYGLERARAEYAIKYIAYDPKYVQKFLKDTDSEISKFKAIKSRYLSAEFSTVSRYYGNSEDTEIESVVPYASGFASFTVEGSGSSRQRNIQIGATKGINYFEESGLSEKILEDSRNMKKVLENGVNVSGRFDNVVISSEIAGIAVHESVGHPNEADRVLGREAAQAGTSYVTPENLGLRIGSAAVTIYDDPTIKESFGFYLFDDEGVGARRRTIVENGLQKELLHNRESAFLMKSSSNGSARSDSVANEPIIRMANTYLAPGRAKFEELIEEARDGVYVKNFTEWNIDDTRSFSRYQGNEAYLIKNGRIGKPIKNFTLETKTLDFWGAVSMVDSELVLYAGTCGKGEPEQGVPVLMGGPDALLRFKREV
ncbi:MAG: TldD/PmbA family protein [Candidatus Micrarchaeaceae archaeon]